MLTSSTNSQVIYSLDMLSDSLLSLLTTKKFDKITIKEICEKANITRTTFYRNCDDKIDLITYLCKKYTTELFKTIPWKNKDTSVLFEHFFVYWSNKKDFLMSLEKNDLFPTFVTAFIDICTNRINYQFAHNSKEAIKYINCFVAGGLCSILHTWVKEGMNTSNLQLSSILHVYFPNDIRDDLFN